MRLARRAARKQVESAFKAQKPQEEFEENFDELERECAKLFVSPYVMGDKAEAIIKKLCAPGTNIKPSNSGPGCFVVSKIPYV